MLKKLLYFVLITTLVLSVGAMSVFAVGVNSNEETLKLQSLNNENQLENDNSVKVMTAEEIQILDTAFELSQIQSRKDDADVSNIILKISGDTTMQKKAFDSEKQGRIEIMKYIIEYIEAGNDKEINQDDLAKLTNYVQSYGPYTDDMVILSYIEGLKENGFVTAAITGYDSNTAVYYAKIFYGTFNIPLYPNVTAIGGDCANFVSQALKAGGISTDGTWYITRKNTTYTSPTTIAQLDYSWTLADPSPWISANQFNNYWSSRANSTYVESGTYAYANQSVLFSEPYYLGDVVQILKKVYWWYEGYHTMIITNYDSGDYLLTYHTTPTQDKALHTILNSYNSDLWQIKFFGMQ